MPIASVDVVQLKKHLVASTHSPSNANNSGTLRYYFEERKNFAGENMNIFNKLLDMHCRSNFVVMLHSKDKYSGQFPLLCRGWKILTSGANSWIWISGWKQIIFKGLRFKPHSI